MALRHTLLLTVSSALFALGCGDDSAPIDAGTSDGSTSDASVDGGVDPARCDPANLDGVEAGSWDPTFTIDGLTGRDGFTSGVHALASDSSGALVAAGYFRWAGTEHVGPIARVSEGAWESAREGVAVEDVGAVAIDGARWAYSTFRPLFPIPDAPPQGGEIFVDTGTGAHSIGEFLGIVRALAWRGDELWAAGFFSMDGGIAGLAVWDGTSWSAPPGGAVNGPVYTLLRDGDSIVAGGSFTRVGGVDARAVAEWNGSEWTAYSMSGLEPSEPYGPFAGPIVYGLVRGGDGTLYAGGVFHPSGTPTAGGVARWTGTRWEILGSGLAQYGGLAGDFSAVVADVEVHRGDLYAAGCFSRRGSDPEGAGTLPGVARWSGTAWEPLPGGADAGIASVWFHANVCGAEPSGTAIMETDIQALHSAGNLLYVAGTLDGIDGVPSKSIIAHDGERWVPQGDGRNGLVGAASELAAGGDGCDLYAFSGMSHAGDATGSALYRFDGTAWAAVDVDLPEGLVCTQLAVSAGGVPHIGCETEWTADPEPTPPVPRVFRLEGGAWVALPDAPGAIGSLVIGDMAFDAQGRLWLAGGDGLTGFLATWNGDALDRVETAFDGTVTRVAFAPDGSVIVGGGFAHVGALDARGVVRWTGTSWEALGAGIPTIPETPVSGLAVAGDVVYVSTHSGTGSHFVLARFDGTSWEELGVAERGLLPPASEEGVHQFYELYAVGTQVIAAGSALPREGGRNAFLFDGESFTALGGGVGAISVDALAVTPDSIWLGGMIATTGHDATLAPSVGIARFRLAE